MRALINVIVVMETRRDTAFTPQHGRPNITMRTRSSNAFPRTPFPKGVAARSAAGGSTPPRA